MGKGEELKGRAKEAAGAATDDDELKNEGKRDQTAAKVKEKAGDAVDSVKDALNRD